MIVGQVKRAHSHRALFLLALLNICAEYKYGPSEDLSAYSPRASPALTESLDIPLTRPERATD